MLNSFLRGLFVTEESPSKVLEVRSDNYISRPIQYRQDSLLLYGPKTPPDKKNSKDKYYEIVLHKPFTESLHQVYSLFRSESREEAEDRFIVYKEKVPLYVEITRECSVPILQKVCDTLSEHKSWSIAHLVAHFDLPDLCSSPGVREHINDIEPFSGATPLMVALKGGNMRMVHSLLALRCSLETVDHDGNNVFHYAAASNKDTIAALANSSTTNLNTYNKHGYTPLHTACLADAPACVRALLIAGADVNLSASRGTRATALPGIVGDILSDRSKKLHTQDMKHGGTPLHWAISREVVETLVDLNCDVQAQDFHGRTALHVMVMRGRLACVVTLAVRGAELSAGDHDGNTPLHLAVSQPSVAMVQALIVFGADLEAKNRDGFTPRHVVPADMSSGDYDRILYCLHAVGAQRCGAHVSGCRSGCSTREEYAGLPPAAVARAPTRDLIGQLLESGWDQGDQHKQGRLLCLDGGGIRGLVLIQLLIALEETTGQPIVSCFDWVAGTSTGAILALALSTGHSLRECQRLYFKMKDLVFVGSRPYPTEPLETILKECLGTDTVMADIDHPKLMILAVAADRKPVDLHIFRNYQSAQDIIDEVKGSSSPGAEAGDHASVSVLPPQVSPAEQLVWQAARASGAAPSYFRSSGRYLDGGLIGNNPTLDALTELAELKMALSKKPEHELSKKTNLKVVVSCGTGLPPVTRLKDIDVFMPDGFWATARLAMGMSVLGKLLVDQATQSDGRVVDRARAWCSALGVSYYRFCPQMSSDVAMDERADDQLVGVLWETAAYMHEHGARVADVARLLTDA